MSNSEATAVVTPPVVQIILPNGTLSNLSVAELGVHVFAAFAVNTEEDPQEAVNDFTQEGFKNLGKSFIESFEDSDTHPIH